MIRTRPDRLEAHGGGALKSNLFTRERTKRKYLVGWRGLLRTWQSGHLLSALRWWARSCQRPRLNRRGFLVSRASPRGPVQGTTSQASAAARSPSVAVGLPRTRGDRPASPTGLPCRCLVMPPGGLCYGTMEEGFGLFPAERAPNCVLREEARDRAVNGVVVQGRLVDAVQRCEHQKNTGDEHDANANCHEDTEAAER